MLSKDERRAQLVCHWNECEPNGALQEFEIPRVFHFFLALNRATRGGPPDFPNSLSDTTMKRVSGTKVWERNWLYSRGQATSFCCWGSHPATSYVK